MNCSWISLVVLFLAETCFCRMPKVSMHDPSSGTKDAYVNQETHLTCRIKQRDGRTVIWKRENEGKFYDLASGLVVYTPSKHFVTRLSGFSQLWRLAIKHTSLSDQGTYYCGVYVTISNFVQARASVQVVEAPVIDTVTSTLSVTVEENEPVVLKCNAHGTPTPSVAWTRIGGKQLPTGGPILMQSALEIPRVKPDDRGTYMCRARNRAGEDDEKVSLDVQFLPVMTSEKLVYKQARGYDKELTCYVESNPDLLGHQLSWSKDGRVIDGDRRRIVTFLRGAQHKVTWKLYIKSLEDSDFGTYTCGATVQRTSEVRRRKLDVRLELSDEMVFDAAQVISHAVTVSMSLTVMVCASMLVYNFSFL